MHLQNFLLLLLGKLALGGLVPQSRSLEYPRYV